MMMMMMMMMMMIIIIIIMTRKCKIFGVTLPGVVVKQSQFSISKEVDWLMVGCFLVTWLPG